MMEIKAKDLLKTDYQILGEKYIILNKGIDELIKKYDNKLKERYYKLDLIEKQLEYKYLQSLSEEQHHISIEIFNYTTIIQDLKRLKGE